MGCEDKETYHLREADLISVTSNSRAEYRASFSACIYTLFAYHAIIFFCFLSSDKGKPLIILADLYVEAFGNIKEANMVSLLHDNKTTNVRSHPTFGS